MKARWLIHNARVHTQSDGLVVDSLAVYKNRIVAVGNRLEHDPDFSNYTAVNLGGLTVVPGFVDAHTHFAYYAETLGQVHLQNKTSLQSCLRAIVTKVRKLDPGQWLLGEGYAPDRFTTRVEPTAAALDAVTGDHPACLLSKDEHSIWANTRALKLSDITSATSDPEGGRIERDSAGHPTGILREVPAMSLVLKHVTRLSDKQFLVNYRKALREAYRQGVTGIHSFDDTVGLKRWQLLARKRKTGVRVNYYPPAAVLDDLLQENVYFGTGDDLFRVAGIKLFADGSLGSRTALCFNHYKGDNTNFGIEVTSVADMRKAVKKAARLNLPAAIHAIGDRAVANVLDALDQAPPLEFGARHRIEHVQLVRRKDIARMKKLGVTASVQPSHCPSDIDIVRTFWGARGRNAFVFRSILDKEIPLAFGSDLPIEPLDPIDGIAAAVRRARPGKRDVFYPEQRIPAKVALHAFTAGTAFAVGQEHCRGHLLPGYPADFVVLSQDLTRCAASRIYDTEVLATFLDGKPKYRHKSFNW